MYDSQIAGIEAEDSGECNHDDRECPACLHRGEWDDKYGASDHAIDHGKYGCWKVELFMSMLNHK